MKKLSYIIMCVFIHFSVVASDELQYFNFDDDTEVMRYYKSCKKKEYISIAAAVVTSPCPPLFLGALCGAADYAYSYKIYKLLKAAKAYMKDHHNRPEVLRKFFNKLVIKYPHQGLKLKDVAHQLNRYADMPLANRRLWRAKSYQYNKTQLMIYLFRPDRNQFDSHYQEQKLIYDQILH